MRKINYKTLKGQNFLSLGNDEVSINFKKGFNLITGKNIDNPERKNAVGKSAMIELFYFALFGTTIRDIKKDFIVNNVTKGKGNIELTFDVISSNKTSSYKIVRQIKPATCELYRCGDTDEDISKDSIANTNKYICDLIGSNPIICKSCDILSLSDNVPFMAKKPEEKRKFIEDIFALDIFGKMLKDLKELIKENKFDLGVSTSQVEEVTKNLESWKEQLKETREQHAEHENIILKRKEDLLDTLERLQKKYDELAPYSIEAEQAENEKLHELWSKIDGKVGRILFEMSEIHAEKKVKQDKLAAMKSVDGAVCDKCFQKIPHSHKEHLEELATQLDREIISLSSDYDDYSKEKADLYEKKEKVQDKVAKNQLKIDRLGVNELGRKEVSKRMTECNQSLNEIEDDIERISRNVLSLEERIKAQEERLKELTNKHDELKQQAEDLETCKFVLGEEGVKSFIIKNLLTMLNSSIQKYITKLGMSMRCKFDEYFDEKITNEKGKEISYWNFSGGERRTVDLACAWAFKDMKQKITGISSNVEFLDEWMDSAFDSTGFDKMVDLLKSRIDKNKLACYVISHRNETLKHVDGEVVELAKEHGVTRRITS